MGKGRNKASRDRKGSDRPRNARTAFEARASSASAPRDALVVGVLACLTLWRIFEMDLFWALRAGREIVRSHSIPMTETWSYTVPGTPWLNTHWLTELLTYTGFAIGGYGALVLLRVLVVALWLSLVLMLVRRFAPRIHDAAAYAFLALVFVASTYRMELRGEIFVLVAFTAVLWLFASKTPRRELLSAALVFVAANFHAGQAVMVLAAAIVLTAWEARTNASAEARPAVANAPAAWHRTATRVALLVAAFFATPVHIRAVAFAYEHLRYHSVLGNPDHQPMSFALFDVEHSGQGLSYWAWSMLTAMAGFALWRARRHRVELPVGFWPLAGFVTALTALSIDRVRAVPFAATVAAPLAAHVWTAVVDGGREGAPSRAPAGVRKTDPSARAPAPPRFGASASLAVALSAAIAVFIHVRAVPRHYGFGVDDRTFPVHAADFIAREKPAPNLYHTFTFGAYLVWALPDYKLFGDTRETPFRDLTELYLEAYGSSSTSQWLYDKYGVNTLMMPIPGTERLGDMGYRDLIEEYTPRDKWALVYFDDSAIVVLRRTPENARIIAENEYTVLRPNIPAEWVARGAVRDPERAERFRRELERCLGRGVRVTWCERAELTSKPYSKQA